MWSLPTNFNAYLKHRDAWYKTLEQMTCTDPILGDFDPKDCAKLSWLQQDRTVERYLTPELTGYLQVENDEFTHAKQYEDLTAGKHFVIPIHSVNAFAKLYPERPLLFLQRNVFSWLLFGYGAQGSLCRFETPEGRVYPLLITPNAGEVFNHKILTEGYESALDTYNFTLKVIETALARSRNEDLENIAWERLENPEGISQYRLVTFDGDHGIGHMLLKKPRKLIELYLRSMVYCMDMMNSIVNEQAITAFCLQLPIDRCLAGFG